MTESNDLNVASVCKKLNISTGAFSERCHFPGVLHVTFRGGGVSPRTVTNKEPLLSTCVILTKIPCTISHVQVKDISKLLLSIHKSERSDTHSTNCEGENVLYKINTYNALK